MTTRRESRESGHAVFAFSIRCVASPPAGGRLELAGGNLYEVKAIQGPT